MDNNYSYEQLRKKGFTHEEAEDMIRIRDEQKVGGKAEKNRLGFVKWQLGQGERQGDTAPDCNCSLDDKIHKRCKHGNNF